ncbi:hypothetical protein HUB98_22640 [Paenibacillus barcinonensis]|uniref:Heptaprenyl diphosphate synthase n=1 Tax=Paenibacillus barcinonensis TaxID=198119 RepID=A0A2V4V7D7_PAEBA|nr:hypothetical protein [Paenibacillus barcinonensis]PYE48560.1 hypothetical protein DFQ00_108152 [Paenibacillus barcinonensis]QKS58741.1 hypothetical protein HUB98_22640 [Paenibacillus barcinonensis]
MIRREWLDPYTPDIEAVFAAAEDKLRQYPESLTRHALEQLHQLHPVRKDSGLSCIGYITPLWMHHTDGLPLEKAHLLSTACLLHMLYFLNMDDVMDEPEENAVAKLTVGNLYYLDALQLYSLLFEPTSEFWVHFRRVIQEWAVSVNGERHIDYFQLNPLLIAQKASPSQLGAIGSQLLLEQPGRISTICDALNIVLMTLQMTDDFTDMKQDAVHGNYNSYLSHISAALHQDYLTHPVHDSILDHVYHSHFMDSYAEIASHFKSVLTSSNSALPQYIVLNSYLHSALIQAVLDIKQRKKRLYQGGFHYWISEASSKFPDKGNADSV